MPGRKPPPRSADLPFASSVGYQVRATHRLLQRVLQLRIGPYGVTLGMWYFLRALWNEDGLTQRELSRRVGTMEPTTLSAILALEKRGFVRRARNARDRRKMHVHLTTKGCALRRDLIPLARDVVRIATRDLPAGEAKRLLATLGRVQHSLADEIARLEGAPAPAQEIA